MAKKEVVGFVVQKEFPSHFFLNQAMDFVPHGRGIIYAWVHGELDLLQGGDWITKVAWVWPARFNPKTGRTEIAGQKMSYDNFAIRHSKR